MPGQSHQVQVLTASARHYFGKQILCFKERRTVMANYVQSQELGLELQVS
jgi:hypothetical protein